MIDHSLLVLVFLSGCFSSAAPSPEPTTTAPVSVDTLLVLDRWDAYNGGPTYRVEVDGSGAVRYVGEEFVLVEGDARHQVPPAAVARLVEAFQSFGHGDLPSTLGDAPDGETSICTLMSSDSASATTTLKTGQQEHTVYHYHGCHFDGAIALAALEDEIDRILGTAQWVDDAWPATRWPTSPERRAKDRWREATRRR